VARGDGMADRGSPDEGSQSDVGSFSAGLGLSGPHALGGEAARSRETLLSDGDGDGSLRVGSGFLDRRVGASKEPPSQGGAQAAGDEGQDAGGGLAFGDGSRLSTPRTRNRGALIEPLPNLFRATFQQARSHASGEAWLQERIQAFDGGSKHQRKQVLEEFMEYIGQSTASSMEELFSSQAHLLFIRLTSWFSITLPLFFELTLQLKVFLTFLEFREQVFIRAFFESGTVVPLMHTLSVDFDVPDEVRCLAILVLHKLAAHGRQHKELLCAEGLVSNLLECVSDGLRWETLKYAGRLLCELFAGNPKYQSQVLDALQDFMTQRLPLTQRVGTQAFISLLAGEGAIVSPLLHDPMRHRVLVQRALALLESPDLRVGADAYCLLCRLLRRFDCDELLGEFARRQLRTNLDSTKEWLRVESDARVAPGARAALPEGKEGDVPQFGGRHQPLVTRLHASISSALAAAGGAPTGAPGGALGSEAAEVMRRTGAGNAEFAEAFRAEAGCILKWGLLMYLSKRSSSLCEELVDGGLTETLLMCLLDVAHPVQQAAALVELHHLQLLSSKAKQIAEAVLLRGVLLRALTLDQFMQVANAEDLSAARCRLRNRRAQQSAGHRISAQEHGLQQDLMEKEMAEALGVQPMPSDFFLTEQPDTSPSHAAPSRADGLGKAMLEIDAVAKPAAGSAEEEEDFSVARSGKEIFGVQRRPNPEKADTYILDRGSIQEIPFFGSLASFLIDPLDLTADEDSPLLAELRNIEACVGLSSPRGPGAARPFGGGGPGARAVPPRSSKYRADGRKPQAHRPSQAHHRAMALRNVAPLGFDPMPMSVTLEKAAARPTQRPFSVLSFARSEATDVSLQMAGLDDPLAGLSCSANGSLMCCGHGHSHSGHFDVKPSTHDSLADTTAGAEYMPEFASVDEFSRELLSVGETDLLAAGNSFMSGSYADLTHSQSNDRYFGSFTDIHSSRPDFKLPPMDAHVKVQASVVRRSALAAEIELRRVLGYTGAEFTDSLAAEGAAFADPFFAPQAQVEERAHKRILRVSRAPYHDCIAFDKADFEEERARLGKADGAYQTTPSAQVRLRELKIAGGFPRRGVQPKGPHSARLPYRLPAEAFDEHRAKQRPPLLLLRAAGEAAVASGSQPRSGPSSRRGPGSAVGSDVWPELSLPPLSQRGPGLGAAGAGAGLKSFFPASVRPPASSSMPTPRSLYYN